MKSFFYFALLLIAPALFGATTYYVTDAGAGSANGSNLANAWSAANFNNASNWSGTIGTAGKISPDDSVSLNGTVATQLVTQGAGTAGHPITIFAANSSAKLSRNFWGGSGVALAINHSYITADGMNVGIIEATDNGTSLGHQAENTAIVITSATNVIVKNWTLQNLYVRVLPAAGDTTSGSDSAGVFISSATSNCNNCTIDNNIVINCANGIVMNYGSSAHDITISNNTTSYNNWSINVGDRGNTGDSITNVLIVGNNCSQWSNWNDDNPEFSFHHNGVFLFNNNSTGTMASPIVANNFFGSGLGGAHQTSTTFINGGITTLIVINNIYARNDGESTGNGAVDIGGLYATTVSHIYNNTLYQAGSTRTDAGISVNNSFSNSQVFNVRNNITVGPWFYNVNVIINSNGILNANHNIYYNAPTFSVGAGNENLVAWKGFGFDTDAVTTDPKLDGTYHLQATSSAIGAGVNLTSLGITLLNSDKSGAARPTGATPWDNGAYNYVSGAPGITSITIPTNGNSVSYVLSASCTTGAGGSGGMTLSASGGAVTLTYSSGSGSTTYVYTTSRTIQVGETVSATYVQPGNGIEATSGGVDLPSFSSAAVTNNSTQGSAVAVTISTGPKLRSAGF